MSKTSSHIKLSGAFLIFAQAPFCLASVVPPYDPIHKILFVQSHF